ncbi:MAG TPA: DUF3459 domain-containing protein, partial [Opitutaceae bacterium]|nr:DUF3459 domain-containing protein [Opitutaceae bacterium]
APALFERLPVFWQPKQRESFRETYRQLIALRHQHPALRGGDVVWLENTAQQDVVSFLRQDKREELVAVVNFSNRARLASIGVTHGGEFSLALGSGARADRQQPALPNVLLGAFEWAIYLRPLAP